VMADRSLLKNAILESTRWYSDALFPRKVMRDTVLHGTKLLAGAQLHVCIGAAKLPPIHDDPFDRFIIAAAKLNDWAVVTGDGRFEEYGVTVLS